MVTPAVWAAERFPSKPITWICPYGAGGNADTRSRLVAKGMSAVLGQPIIVENKPGGSGAVAALEVVRAEPDGHTLLLYGNNLWILPFMRTQVPRFRLPEEVIDEEVGYILNIGNIDYKGGHRAQTCHEKLGWREIRLKYDSE